jgi:hypothetical protein
METQQLNVGLRITTRGRRMSPFIDLVVDAPPTPLGISLRRNMAMLAVWSAGASIVFVEPRSRGCLGTTWRLRSSMKFGNAVVFWPKPLMRMETSPLVVAPRSFKPYNQGSIHLLVAKYLLTYERR